MTDCTSDEEGEGAISDRGFKIQDWAESGEGAGKKSVTTKVHPGKLLKTSWKGKAMCVSN